MSQVMDTPPFGLYNGFECSGMFNHFGLHHKSSEGNFDLSLTVAADSATPNAPHHPQQHHYMSNPGALYGSYESAGRESYGEIGGLPPPQEPDSTTQMGHNPLYQQQMPHHGGSNPQFPPQNLYIPPISSTMMTTQYAGAPLCSPVYTSAAVPHLSMMGGMMGYYHRPAPRSPPNSGGSPSPGSEDSDDSNLLTQTGRVKRPTPGDTPEVPTPPRGKKPKVSKKSKKKKDPNEPQKPVSAYALFFRDTQAAIKGQNPNASFGEVSKIVASMWDSLDAEHKSSYKKKTEAAKKEYLKALAAYRASLVSKGVEGEAGPMYPPCSGYPQYGATPPGYGYPPTTNTTGALVHPHSPSQMSPLVKKSPLLTSLMNESSNSLMTPPMSQPMPPSGPPPMMTHGAMQGMANTPMGGPPSQPPPTHQQQSGQHILNSVPSSSPYMSQQTTPALASPGGGGGMSDTSTPSPQQHQLGHTQQQNPQQQGPPHHHHIPQQASPQQVQGGQPQGLGQQPHARCPSSIPPNCVRSGCNNPAVPNPEWEDEYCSNECVVSHCSDVFNAWVASNHQVSPPTYHVPVK